MYDVFDVIPHSWTTKPLCGPPPPLLSDIAIVKTQLTPKIRTDTIVKNVVKPFPILVKKILYFKGTVHSFNIRAIIISWQIILLMHVFYRKQSVLFLEYDLSYSNLLKWR